LFVALGGLFAIMIGMVLYASLDNPHLEQVEIKLSEINVLDVNNRENRASLQIVFLVKNPSEKTFTVPLITYEIFANSKSLGTGQYSTEDIAMPGRAAFYPGAEVPLKSVFQLVQSADNVPEFNSITTGEYVSYKIKGVITVETAWALIEKEFESSLS
jgi:hypothetical protein